MAVGESVAWVDVLPSMSRWMPELNKGIQAAMPSAGQAAGQAYGKGWGAGAADQVTAASARMAAAMRKQADAAGEVRIAETRLNDLRNSGKATQTQLVTAEERLEKARRNQAAADATATDANTRLTAAQKNHTTAVSQSNQAQEAHTKTSRTFTERLSALHGAVITAYGAFLAFRVVGNFFGAAISGARDLNEEVNKSTVVFGDAGQRVLAWSKTTATALGISQQQALSSAGTFGNLFRTMGLAPQVSADMSIGLVKLASDLASFNNASPEDVLEAMRAGLVGEMEPMRRFGVDLSDAALKQKALSLGIYEGNGILNQSQKAQAAYALMLDQTTLAQGDFARTSDALANSPADHVR